MQQIIHSLMTSRVHLYSVCRSAEGEDLRVLRIRNRLPLREFTCTHVCWKGPRVHFRQPVQNEHTEGLGLPITIQWNSQQETWDLGCPLFVIDSSLVPIWWLVYFWPPPHNPKNRDNTRDIAVFTTTHVILCIFSEPPHLEVHFTPNQTDNKGHSRLENDVNVNI